MMPGGLQQILHLDQHASCARDELYPRRREEHPAPIALKELDVQRPLHLRNLRAQRRLRHEAALGRTPKALRFGHRHHVLELAERERLGAESHDSRVLSEV